MIKNINLNTYLKKIGTTTQIHNVSYFNKGIDLKDKEVVLADFEFSSNYNIFELTIIVVKNNKFKEIWFEEFALDLDDTIFNLDTLRKNKVTSSFNKNKIKMDSTHINKLFNIIDTCDYFVAHNFVAELQCIYKLIYPNSKYDVKKLDLYNQGKVICTNKTFNNKYFKELNIFDNGFSNEAVSNFFGWKVEYNYEKKIFEINNHINKSSFVIKKLPNSFYESESKIGLHNSLFDTIITLTTFISLSKIEINNN
jgi:hypothetical protein